MSFLAKGYKDLWKAIIRPPREHYELADLGPKKFHLEGRNFCRTDLQICSPRGLRLECSHFGPVDSERPAQKLPCVVYLHGNCSSRLEAIAAVPELLPCGITLFCFDMAGSGLSEGEFISLGWYERDDLACIVEHLRGLGTVSCIGLWGRSMGAATALLHGDRDPSIAGMVIDSAFSSLYVLCSELAKDYSKIPGFLVKMARNMVRKTIKKKAKFDLKHLNPIDYVGRCFIPAYFAAATGDNFIRPSHTEALHSKYAGDKSLVKIEGDHNTPRPQFFLDSVAIFFYNTLQCENLPLPLKVARVRKRKGTPAVVSAEEYQDQSLNEEEILRRTIEESLSYK